MTYSLCPIATVCLAVPEARTLQLTASPAAFPSVYFKNLSMEEHFQLCQSIRR